MKNSITFVFFSCMLITIGCGDTQGGKEYLGLESKAWLPDSTTVRYVNQDSLETQLVLEDTKNYFVNTLVESDAGFLGLGSSDQYNDLQHMERMYESDQLRITYKLSMTMSNAGKDEFLTTRIHSKADGENRIIKVLTSGESYDDIEFEARDSLQINGHTYIDVAVAEIDNTSYYFKPGRGLIAFELSSGSWCFVK